MAKLDYSIASQTYDKSRDLGFDALASWRAAVTRFDPGGDGHVLDLGSGTGVFSRALSDWFNAKVIAVEPNVEMREVAQAMRADAQVQYIEGDASRIPSRDGSCKIAWLSTVVHHIDSLSDAATEMSRVLNRHGLIIFDFSDTGRAGRLA